MLIKFEEFEDGRVCRLTLNRPERRNALNKSLVNDIIDALNRVQNHPEVRCLILTGEGKSFCAGGDIEEMKHATGLFEGSGEELADRYRQGIQQIPLKLNQLKAPVISAINGAAYGAGCDMAFYCDLKIAVKGAQFAENFVKIGIIPGDGGAWLLPRIFGPTIAAELALTGRPFTAEEALQWGGINRVVEADQLQQTAMDTARAIANNPPFAVQNARQLLRSSLDISLADHLDQAAQIQAQCHADSDHKSWLKTLG